MEWIVRGHLGILLGDSLSLEPQGIKTILGIVLDFFTIYIIFSFLFYIRKNIKKTIPIYPYC